MEKEEIINYLEKNKVENGNEFKNFLNQDLDHHSRSTLSGHITASAFILNDDLTEALLILHKKYNKWLSPGGHVDAGENALKAAERETSEEVGLKNLTLLKKEIFDIDVHKIPESNKNGKHEPEHWHFDVRYAFKADKNSIVNLNELEAKGFQWVKLDILANVNDPSIARQAEKAINFNQKPKRKMKIL